MADSVRRAPVRVVEASVASTPTSTTTARAKPVAKPTVATADAVTGTTTLGASPVKRVTQPKAPGSVAVPAERPNFTITPTSPRGNVTADSRTIRMPGTATGPDRGSLVDRVGPDSGFQGDQFGPGFGPNGVRTQAASTSDVIDGIDKGRQYFIRNPEDGGGATAAPGLGEAADAIGSGSKSTADALKAAMPNLDDAGSKELAKLMKTAAAAKGVSIASLVLSVGDVAMNWKNHGIDDPRTQDSLASLVGGSTGAAIGMALGGPLGAALGGMIGSYLGPKVADFARDLADKYGDDVKEAVGAMADGVKAVGSSIADAAEAVGDMLGDLWDGVWGDGGIVDDITPDLPDIDLPGIDIPFF